MIDLTAYTLRIVPYPNPFNRRNVFLIDGNVVLFFAVEGGLSVGLSQLKGAQRAVQHGLIARR